MNSEKAPAGAFLLRTLLRANGSRECAPVDKLREAIHLSTCGDMDCFAALAMTANGLRLGLTADKMAVN
jgi:hypothetical protein